MIGWRLGLVVHDEAGRAWVYYGHRITSVGSIERRFILHAKGRFLPGIVPWMYHAVERETLVRRFPDLASEVPEKMWRELELI